MGKKVASPSLKALLSQPLRDANFRRLLKFSVSWNFAVNLAIPFFTVYLLRRLGYSLTVVVILSVLSQAANILSLRVWGKLSDRFSNKSILLVSGPLLLLSILAWPFTMMPDKYFLTVPLVAAINILSGLSLAGVTLGTTNIALKLSPRGCATSYLATSGFLNSLSAGAASLIGGAAGLFFASKELLLRFGGIGDRFGIQALRLQGLDFLFVIAFVIGIYSMYCLTKVAEEGEVKERVFIGVLTSAMMQQMRSLSTMSGLRALALMPLHIVRDGVRRLSIQRSGRKSHAT
jgi:MFS family permease